MILRKMVLWNLEFFLDHDAHSLSNGERELLFSCWPNCVWRCIYTISSVVRKQYYASMWLCVCACVCAWIQVFTCMCLFACVNSHTGVCMCVWKCVCVCKYRHTFSCVCMCACVSAHRCLFVCMHIHACVWFYMHLCMCVCVGMCVYVCRYVFMCVYACVHVCFCYMFQPHLHNKVSKIAFNIFINNTFSKLIFSMPEVFIIIVIWEILK